MKSKNVFGRGSHEGGSCKSDFVKSGSMCRHNNKVIKITEWNVRVRYATSNELLKSNKVDWFGENLW